MKKLLLAAIWPVRVLADGAFFCLVAILFACQLAIADDGPAPAGLVDLTTDDASKASSTIGYFLSGCQGAKAAYDNVLTGTDHRIISQNSKLLFDIVYSFDQATNVNAYQIFFGPITDNYEMRAPSAWTFQGSDDGVNWTVLDSRSCETNWVKNESRYFEFGNNALYRKYRMLFSDNGGKDPGSIIAYYTQFWEVEYYHRDEMVPPFNPKNFSKRFEVTFPGCTNANALVDFPVLVRLSESIEGFSYADFALSQGGDLRFAMADGTLLSHEIDTWNESGESLVWVKIPSLTPNTKIYAYWGNLNPPTVYAQNVWTPYAGVWHMGIGSSSVVPFKENLENNTGMLNSSSRLGNGYTFDGSKLIQMQCPFVVVTNLAMFTVSTWIKPSRTDKTMRIYSSKRAADNIGMELIYGNGDGLLLRGDGNSLTVKTSDKTANYPKDEWSMMTGVWNDSTGTIYRNGQQIATGSITAVTGHPIKDSDPDKKYLFVGGFGENNNVVYGEMDEVRVYNGVASADWIRTEYDSINNTSFATLSQSVSRQSGILIFVH